MTSVLRFVVYDAFLGKKQNCSIKYIGMIFKGFILMQLLLFSLLLKLFGMSKLSLITEEKTYINK